MNIVDYRGISSAPWHGLPRSQSSRDRGLVDLREKVVIGTAESEDPTASRPTRCSRAVLDLGVLHPVSKGLCTVELGTLTKLVHPSFARRLVFRCVHLRIVLRLAPTPERCIEGTVAAIQNVDLGIGEMRVAVAVESPVLLSNKLCPTVR